MNEAGVARLAALAANGTIQRVTELLQKDRGGPWLVGGAIRDLLLGRRPAGFDFLATCNVLTVAPILAKELSAPWEMTDRSFRHATIRHSEGLLTVTNLSSAETIEENLSRRDFTMNSLALDMGELFARPVPRVIDLRQGMADLEQKLLQPCTWRGLLDEPARILRGIRFQQEIGCKMPSMARSQVTSGKVRELQNLDIEFWEELLPLLAIGDEEVDRQLTSLEIGPSVIRLSQGGASGERGAMALSQLRSLLSPLSWSRTEQKKQVEQVNEEWGREVRLLLLLLSEEAGKADFVDELAGKGAPEDFLERVLALHTTAVQLRRQGFPWHKPKHCELTGVAGAAALYVAAHSLTDVEEGRKNVPAGPEPGTLARRALTELLRSPKR